jgi:hypothetical protein
MIDSGRRRGARDRSLFHGHEVLPWNHEYLLAELEKKGLVVLDSLDLGAD